MQIDNDRHQEETGNSASAAHTVAGQYVHEAAEPGRSGIAKLLAWPHSESILSGAGAEETGKRPGHPESDRHGAGRVKSISQWKRTGLKRISIRVLLLVVVLASAVVMGEFALHRFGGSALKGLWNDLLSFAAVTGKGATRGQVTGIIHSNDKPSAVIDGSLVHEGDILCGVRIVKISFEKVEFERDGQIWSQSLRETPAKYWPDSPQGGAPK